jgi:hypothetical protein
MGPTYRPSMGRTPRLSHLAVTRGIKKGICSFFARSTSFSSGRRRILIYLETSSHPFCSPNAFRSYAASYLFYRFYTAGKLYLIIENFNPSTDQSQNEKFQVQRSYPASTSLNPKQNSRLSRLVALTDASSTKRTSKPRQPAAGSLPCSTSLPAA